MDKIAVLDFGGQYAHLIANRIRRLGVYSEILDGKTPAYALEKYKGVVFSGGPASVKAADSVKCDPKIFELGVPVLGICYGHQLMGYLCGGDVAKGSVREYGPATIKFSKRESIFKGIKEEEPVWMSHFDQVVKLPEGFELIGSSSDCKIAAMMNLDKKLFGVQFHPEVTHTPCGMTILENFVAMTGAKREWNIDSYIEDITQEIKNKVGNKKVFLLVSGGVDSTVAFLLISKALGSENVYGLFVDTGFMRMNERKEVEESLKKVGVTNLHVYDASEEYLDTLRGIVNPETKRKLIGDLFLDIQEKVSNNLNLNQEDWIIAQGTIYPDTIETGGTKYADKIKTHHNRVPRIQELIRGGKVIEPLSQLYKDEVRLVGERLGLDNNLIWRHPFPGPGLAVRCLCNDTEDYPENYKKTEEEINKATSTLDLNAKILPIKSVGVQGDERTYKHPLAILGNQKDWHNLSKLGTKMTNQFPDVNRVIYALNINEINSLNTRDSDLSKDRISLLQQADKIVMDFIREMKIDREIWQFPTVLIPLSVNSKNGESLVLRPVCSEEAMTANFYQMNFDNLNELVKRLSGLKGITGIFYDITNKPPGTIEWE